MCYAHARVQRALLVPKSRLVGSKYSLPIWNRETAWAQIAVLHIPCTWKDHRTKGENSANGKTTPNYRAENHVDLSIAHCTLAERHCTLQGFNVPLAMFSKHVVCSDLLLRSLRNRQVGGCLFGFSLTRHSLRGTSKNNKKTTKRKKPTNKNTKLPDWPSSHPPVRGEGVSAAGAAVGRVLLLSKEAVSYFARTGVVLFLLRMFKRKPSRTRHFGGSPQKRHHTSLHKPPNTHADTHTHTTHTHTSTHPHTHTSP